VLDSTGARIALAPCGNGYFEADANLAPGTSYRIALDSGELLPDPASRFQPEGIGGPSQLVDLASFEWSDSAWRGLDLRDLIIYELHVGTFTAAGTLDAAIADLDRLRELGVTAIELMPLAQFPGARNWGYDGVFPFAVQNSYGGPLALQRFVDAAHARGLAVILDVVYNHLGPEGNRLDAFGPYFTDRYRTPWGRAVNFDGPDSDAVREFFISNALYWLNEFHLDGLRLDAVHGIFDFGARHFLAELQSRVSALEEHALRTIHLIAESDLNDSKLVRPAAEGGYELAAQWSDDFHHSLHVLLTGERNGYYSDFNGVEDLARVFREGWRYSGDYSSFRHRRHGNSPEGLAPEQFVVCSQNHDQVGNRAAGDRLSASLNADQLKLAAAVVLLSPFAPMLFMGEEYGETVPFPYFTSHSDPSLAEAVRRGRRDEFAAFGHAGEIPDPQADATFQSAKLDRTLAAKPAGAEIGKFYRSLIRLRKAAGIAGVWPSVGQEERSQILRLEYRDARIPLIVLFNFGAAPVEVNLGTVASAHQIVLTSTGARVPEPEQATSAPGFVTVPSQAVIVLATSDAAKAMGAS
jgi:maltooligosyltrehalose trehalohydrolase